MEVRGASDFESGFSAGKESECPKLSSRCHPAVVNFQPKTDRGVCSKDPVAGDVLQVGVIVDGGGLMSYASEHSPNSIRRAATYVDKILKGAKPADLPVEQPMKFEFIINLKAAKQIGLTIPPNVLVRADRVIR